MQKTDVAVIDAPATQPAKQGIPEEEMKLSRNIRQKDIIPEAELADWVALVVGCGAIGHQVCRGLAALGCVEAVCLDFDKVGVENLSSQGFCADEVGQFKVDVVTEEMSAMFPEMELRSLAEKFSKKTLSLLRPGKNVVVFSCVDSMAARKEIHKTLKGKAEMLIDTRMGAESGRIISVLKGAWDDYAATLHDDSEAYEGPCTAKSTGYCAMIMGGWAIAQFTRRLRRLSIYPQVSLNIPFGDTYIETKYT